MQTLTMEAKNSAKSNGIDTEIKNIKPSTPSSLQIILAESKIEVSQLLMDEIKKDNHTITVCTNIDQLNHQSSQFKPDILIIGTLQEFSCLEVHRQYSRKWEGLPIILLAPMVDVHEYFRKWAITRGVYDVLSSYPEKLHILRESIQEIAETKQFMKIKGESITEAPQKAEVVAEPISSPVNIAPAISLKEILNGFDQSPNSEPDVKPNSLSVPEILPTHTEVLAALQQITSNSMNYFGGMAIANYWKKSQSLTVIEHPWLSCWTIDYRGAIAYFSSEIPPEQLNSEQFASLQLWVHRFLSECDRIIGGYEQMLGQMDISQQVRQIISIA